MYCILLALAIFTFAVFADPIGADPVQVTELNPELKALLDEGFEVVKEFVKNGDNNTLEQLLQVAEKLFDFADSNKDTVLDVEEYKAVNRKAYPYLKDKMFAQLEDNYHAHAEQMFAEAMKQFDETMESNFAATDQNGDRKLTKEEFMEKAKKTIGQTMRAFGHH